MNDITAFQWGTLGIALAGLTLGIVNLFRDISKGKLKLDVEAGAGSPVDHSGRPVTNPVLYIKIKNKSAFEVTIPEVGFFLTERRRAPVTMVNTFLGDSLPLVLKPNSSGAIYFSNDFRPIATEVIGPYARTDLDVVVYKWGKWNIKTNCK